MTSKPLLSKLACFIADLTEYLISSAQSYLVEEYYRQIKFFLKATQHTIQIPITQTNGSCGCVTSQASLRCCCFAPSFVCKFRLNFPIDVLFDDKGRLYFKLINKPGYFVRGERLSGTWILKREGVLINLYTLTEK